MRMVCEWRHAALRRASVSALSIGAVPSIAFLSRFDPLAGRNSPSIATPSKDASPSARCGSAAHESREDIVSDCAHCTRSDRSARAARARDDRACRATSRSRIATRCSPRLPTATTTHSQLCARRRLRVHAGLPARAGRRDRADDGSRSRPRRHDQRPRRRRPGVAARRRSTAAIPAARCACCSGVVAAHPFTPRSSATARLSRRPMRRIIAPLTRMGARIDAAAGRPAAADVTGGALEGIDFVPDVPSAQVKSAVLLAGLQGARPEPGDRIARSHGIIRSGRCGVRRHGRRQRARDRGRGRPAPAAASTRACPGDLSSAAFPAAAAAALPGSDVTIEGVGLNPTRTALLDVLRRFGADVDVEQTSTTWQGEPVGTHPRARGRRWARSSSVAEIVPAIIDELPVLGALATAGGELRVTGAAELRVKESDRITALVAGLRALGADADELPDGFHIRGGRPLTGGVVDAHDDHRLAMAFAVAALTASGPVTIAAPTPRRCRIRRSSTISIGCARESGQGLSGRLHGRRQDHGGARPGAAPRLAARGHRRADRAARAPRHPDHLPAGRRALLPRPRARGGDRPARRRAARSSPPAAAPSSIPPRGS